MFIATDLPIVPTSRSLVRWYLSDRMGADAQAFCELRIRNVPSRRKEAEYLALNVLVTLIAHQVTAAHTCSKTGEHKGVFTVTL